MPSTVGKRPPRRLLLVGSSSKWRRAALQRFFFDAAADTSTCQRTGSVVAFDAMEYLSPDIDEDAIAGDTPEELCVAIAEAKMDRILSLLTQPSTSDDTDGSLTLLRQLYAQCSSSSILSAAASDALDEFWIICGDQVAVFEGRVRQKPVDSEENVAFLQSYRGKSVHTVAGTVLVDVVRGVRQHVVNHTKTTFRDDLPDDVIARVVQRGDSMQCCGGFVVEDAELAGYIASIEPSLEAVTGLDVHVVASLMRSMREGGHHPTVVQGLAA